jgi:hypothetical protein
VHRERKRRERAGGGEPNPGERKLQREKERALLFELLLSSEFGKMIFEFDDAGKNSSRFTRSSEN